MPALDPPFDPKAQLVAELRNARRLDEAEEIVREQMRTGWASAEMHRQAAELFGGRKDIGLYRWIDIGQMFDALRPTLSHEEAVDALAAGFRRSKKHIEACVTQYRKAREASYE
jgi:hypothetical protein